MKISVSLNKVDHQKKTVSLININGATIGNSLMVPNKPTE